MLANWIFQFCKCKASSSERLCPLIKATRKCCWHPLVGIFRVNWRGIWVLITIMQEDDYGWHYCSFESKVDMIAWGIVPFFILLSALPHTLNFNEDLSQHLQGMSFDYTHLFCIFKLRSNHALAQTCQSHNMYSFSKNKNQTKTKNDSSHSPSSSMIILILSEVKSVELDGSLNLTYVWRSVCMQKPVSAQPVMPSYLGS